MMHLVQGCVQHDLASALRVFSNGETIERLPNVSRQTFVVVRLR